MVNKVGGINQREPQENLPLRVEQRNSRVVYSIVQMIDKLIATRIQSRRSHSTWVPSISTEEISAI